MFVYIYSHLTQKGICDCRNVSIKFPCVYVWLSSGYLLKPIEVWSHNLTCNNCFSVNKTFSKARVVTFFFFDVYIYYFGNRVCIGKPTSWILYLNLMNSIDLIKPASSTSISGRFHLNKPTKLVICMMRLWQRYFGKKWYLTVSFV